ncbi:MAG: restriction endonuclease [Marinisporobacter sp.]|jgi:hypothetical protein|nr:restriction endonuclease [Marinisporobacter sp.]
MRKKKKSAKSNLDVLKKMFINLYQGKSPDGKNINNKERGYHFEKFITELVRSNNIEVTESFKIKGEQIDGSLKYDGEHYLLEMKWHDNRSSTEPLYKFAHKVEGKMYGRGIFISVNGFSSDSVNALKLGKTTKTILIDGQDIFIVLEGLYTFQELLNEKIKAAQTRGNIYIDIVTKSEKI